MHIVYSASIAKQNEIKTMIPTRIGQKCLGGTFVGFIRHNPSINCIIVAPSEYARDDLNYRTNRVPIKNNKSVINGKLNCEHLNKPIYPAVH